MTEIAQLFESALRNNRAGLLRRAAMNTLARMPPETTLRDLLESDAGEAVRALSLQDVSAALREAGYTPRAAATPARGRRVVVAANNPDPEVSATREEQLFRQIVAAVEHEPLTIGQLAKRLDVESDELRGYLTWMKKAGKLTSTGRARATRYLAAR